LTRHFYNILNHSKWKKNKKRFAKMFNDWLMLDDGLVYPNNIIKIKVQQNMGAFPDAILLNCHSNEANNMVHVTGPQHMCFTSHCF
jgi:hypothetical protein